MAIIFSRPECALAKDEILPAIGYFNERGHNTVFYFAGYDVTKTNDSQISVEGPDYQRWYFDARLFNGFREEVEKDTNWRYSGASDMILTNARCDSPTGQMQGRIDFHTAIQLNWIN